MLTYSEVCNDTNDSEWLSFIEEVYPWIDTTLFRLKLEAHESASWRGHTLEWQDNSGYRATGTCTKCGKQVVCLTRPAPNQIDIGGEAVGLNCREEN